jgi:CDP-diacylglycerol--glycerol-3-phosphate 3-phosphatidyltransferase
LYPSNLLTVGRLLLLPLLIYLLNRREQRRAALLCLACAMLTDAIDGPIARRRGEVSRLGELLDPVADKLAIDLTALALSRTHGFPWWATGLLLFRDMGIVLAALLVFRRRSQITTAKSMGKLTTLMLSLAMLAYIADGEHSGRPLLYAALVPFGLSFVQYGREALRMLR